MRCKGLVDAEAIIEVRTLLAFAERWRNDALWPELQNSLRDPNQYVHTLLLLAAHHMWSVARNVVNLERTDGTTRTFDLSMQDLGHSMAAEVKAPFKLRRGGKPPLKALAAKKVVLDAIRKAGTREGGQLPPDKCGILIIGGLSLKQLDLDRLAHGAEALFAARTLSHIGAIQILSIGIHISDPGPVGEHGVSMVAGSCCKLGSASGSSGTRATSVSCSSRPCRRPRRSKCSCLRAATLICRISPRCGASDDNQASFLGNRPPSAPTSLAFTAAV